MDEIENTKKEFSNERLENAIKMFKNPHNQIKIRTIYYNIMYGASIFWDEGEREVSFISNDIDISVIERK